jgi:hypothetical protein
MHAAKATRVHLRRAAASARSIGGAASGRRLKPKNSSPP